MSFPVIVVALDLRDVFHFFFDSIGVSIYCRRVLATTTFSVSLAPRTSLLVVLILLASLALISGRLLMLAIRYVSGRSVSRLSLFKVVLFFFRKLIPSEIPYIYLVGI